MGILTVDRASKIWRSLESIDGRGRSFVVEFALPGGEINELETRWNERFRGLRANVEPGVERWCEGE